jgi:hypothetical protein
MRYFLSLGSEWKPDPHVRRIGIVSTPCDSAAAGLCTLGAIRARLTQPDASDVAWHYRRLLELWARTPGDTLLRYRDEKRRFRFQALDKSGMLWAAPVNSSDHERRIILEEFAADWRIDGEPRTEVSTGGDLPHSAILSAVLAEKPNIAAVNLKRSDSAICLAGRVMGEAGTRSSLSSLEFRIGDQTAALSELLSIHGWHSGMTSRATFFNPRTRSIDREARVPACVFVDGASTFCDLISERSFPDSDIVAIISRVDNADTLDHVADLITTLQQWYDREGDDSVFEGKKPIGVSISVLRRR